MHPKILVAIDNSAFSRDIFQEALDLAKASQGCLFLVHSLSGEEESSPLPMQRRLDSIYWAPGTEINLDAWKDEWHRYEGDSLDHLRHLAGKANAMGIKTEFRQLIGSPGRVICKAAQQWGATMIVMGHRGRSGLSELVMGSVSNYVMHHALCSVLVLKPEEVIRSSLA
ncbi:universal stress protein UspA [Leptolyngbya sp. BL0902]|uniref:universal stress protein n=1 Tax=Leptolyngbya sp. BL0902 TaxID=1115757 RepID=UPI0018E7E442|nr:universal stress protein [Leptolyngbya sp. BL0902]QQE67129.1 universal stress protein UspA [Leptolyngbya sp. BL0902]